MLVLPLFLFILMSTQLVHMFVFIQAKAHHFNAVKGVSICDCNMFFPCIVYFSTVCS